MKSPITDAPMTEQQIREMASALGVLPTYTDYIGTVQTVPTETLKKHMAQLGLDVETNEAFQKSYSKRVQFSWLRWLDIVTVIRSEDLAQGIQITLPEALIENTFYWTITEENGHIHRGEFVPSSISAVESLEINNSLYHRYKLNVSTELRWGYHTLTLGTHLDSGYQELAQRLIVTPGSCYISPDMLPVETQTAELSADESGAPQKQSRRIWGPGVQIYALRSRRNWGMGDLTDLATLLSLSARKGADIIGINPLHALFPVNPQDASPYSPASRLFLNLLYLDIEAIADFEDSEDAQKLVFSDEFQQTLKTLRKKEFVDYPEIMRIKMLVLQKLYNSFRSRQLTQQTGRAHEFQSFLAQGGESLYRFCLFEAIQDRLHSDNSDIWGWPVWPEPYQDPNGDAVRDFADSNRERIQFYQYIQWQLHIQLDAVGTKAWDLGMAVGLYMDLAVGVNFGGADVWSNQSVYAHNASVGAPPDSFSPQGQNWGLPPFLPNALRDSGYQPFIDILRSNMQYAGALRIDHFMALMRLFWVPSGESAAVGGYVHYAFDDMLGILALESHRSQTVVIGEDLGTVPDMARIKMDQWNILSYRVFYFEREEDSSFLPPQHYPVKALVTLTTQDLPTFNGFWYGQANVIQHQLGLITEEQYKERQTKNVLMDRMNTLSALAHENLLPSGVTLDPNSVGDKLTELCQSVYRYLSRTPSLIQVVQLEDILGQLDQVNMPGTVHEHPNWCRKISLDLEAFSECEPIQSLFSILEEERGHRKENAEDVIANPFSENLSADIPQSTYRFQFNKEFTFAMATEMIPYLAQLGITHCYASPLLVARAGSMHGYDITRHNLFNPEIGTQDDFNRLSDAILANNMKLIVDIVPNHMGIGSDNPWWMDVLENGPASRYAKYFDIDWFPLKDELYAKVLLPDLGSPYGQALENEELQLQFDANKATFSLHYFTHFWPINPGSYQVILKHRQDILATRLDGDETAYDSYQSIVAAFERLPQLTQLDTEQIAIRQRERSVTLERLQRLCQEYPIIVEFIQENLYDFNNVKNNTINQQRLHDLLEKQAYRLAYWRVASDEINYRRFFDVKDLAGLNIELPEVFWDTHQFIFEQIKAGKIHGLRIDHPDGLYDPAQYFQRLQEEALKSKGIDAQVAGEQLTRERLPLYVIVEKILAAHERLPEQWLVHGTTGYDFGNHLNAIFIDKANEDSFTQLYQAFTDNTLPVADLIYICKKQIMRQSLSSELNVLTNQLNRISERDWLTRDFTLNNLSQALSDVVACFPVYRTYLTSTELSKKDRHYILWAVEVAKRRNRDLDSSIFDFIRRILLLEIPAYQDDSYREDVTRFTMKFQQFTGPVMAKGLEDTAFYRYNRLISTNEVGGELQHFGASVSAFHHQNQERSRTFPYTMLNTSTHDSKRSEDIRARINVLSEMPDIWLRAVQRWFRINRQRKIDVNHKLVPGPNEEYLLYQTLIGVWSFQAETTFDRTDLCQRVVDYMLKATREAKEETSWINQNDEYEEGITRFVKMLITPESESNAFLDDFLPIQDQIAYFGMLNALSQVVLKLTVPGIPDIYQGQELWAFHLVDPDNRRPVDYARCKQYLSELAPLLEENPSFPEAEALDWLNNMLTHYQDGRIKLYLSSKCVLLRRNHPDLFRDGEYIPVKVIGSKSTHIVAFVRKTAEQAILIITPRLIYGLLNGKQQLPVGAEVWGDTSLDWSDVTLEPVYFKNLITNEAFICENGSALVSQLLSHIPVGMFSVKTNPG